MATNGAAGHKDAAKVSADSYTATTTASEHTATATSGGTPNLSKDEVGWYFVEQYYTTLSKSPEKLHLFYSKRSQFVSGMEAEVAPVAVGRTDIQDRIKELEFQDCKVRVSNVDSQASFDNIVIQVIGEVSNKGSEPKKFVQTFVLAQQPTGYFVLNDIHRFINEDADDDIIDTGAQVEAVDVSAPEESAAESEVVLDIPTTAQAEIEPAPTELDAEKTEETDAVAPAGEAANAEGPNAKAEPDAAEAAAAEEEPVPEQEEPESVPEPVKSTDEHADEPAEPKSPVQPNPVPRAAAPAPEPEKPAKPMTWASRIAAATNHPQPAIPNFKAATTPVTSQNKAPPPLTGPQQPAVAAQPSPDAAAAAKEAQRPATEWQTAGGDHKRQQRTQSISGPHVEKEGTLGYVKYVTDKVKDDDLRAALNVFGELVYFDINRSKNCAFVEFATPAGYQAAAAANPLVVNGENIVVEPRRPKAGAYGGANYNSRGGPLAGRGRGGGSFEGGPRAPGAGANRGGFPGQGRGRGGGGVARGRGGTAQASNV